MDCVGPTLDLHAARQLALSPEPSVDAVLHRGVQGGEPLPHGLGASRSLLVGQLHLGDRSAGFAPHPEHLCRAAERVRIA